MGVSEQAELHAAIPSRMAAPGGSRPHHSNSKMLFEVPVVQSEEDD
jgi:hypothetical protein